MTPTQSDYTASWGRPGKRKQHLDALRLVDLPQVHLSALFACIAIRLLHLDARDWVCQPFTILPLHAPSPLLADYPPIYVHYSFFKDSERLQRGLVGNRSIGKVVNKDGARVLSTYSPPIRFHPRSVNHSSIQVSISICAIFLSPNFYLDQPLFTVSSRGLTSSASSHHRLPQRLIVSTLHRPQLPASTAVSPCISTHLRSDTSTFAFAFKISNFHLA